MAKRTLKVQTPYGFVATRQTDRDYAFVIVVKGQTEAYLTARREAEVKMHLEYAAKYERWIAKAINGVYHEVYNGGYGHADHTVEQLAEYAKRHREDAERVAARPLPEQKPGVFSWTSRYDLAVKQVAQAEKFGYEGILILSVK